MSFQTGTATDVGDLITKLNTFLLLGHSLEPAYTGTGTGTINNLIGTAASVLETINVTFTSATAFSVAGSVSGALGTGTVGVAFTSSKANFTIVAGGTPWAAADTIVFTMTPPWLNKRAVSNSEYIWQAPGNDGISQIFVGAQRFNDVSGDYDNLRLGGFNGFDSAQAFASQPGAMTRPVTPLLRVGSMPYWFVANGRRVVVIAKASTVYESLYLGFINQYANPTQHAYPLLVGGSMSWATEPATNSQTWRWSYQGNEHSAFPFGYSTTLGTNDNNSPTRLRRPDGVYRGYSKINQAFSQVGGLLWPYGYSFLNIRENLDGSYSPYPIVLQETGNDGGSFPNVAITTPQSWGELDGVYAVTGHANASENTITIGRTQYLVIQNVFRNTKTDFFALKLA